MAITKITIEALKVSIEGLEKVGCFCNEEFHCPIHSMANKALTILDELLINESIKD